MYGKYLALAALLLALGGTLHAATIYVDANAPNDPGPGNAKISDPAEDGSATHPFDEVQKAINAAQDGDTVVVAPGHYLSADPFDYDQIHFKGKNIRLVSSAPTDFSTVNQTILCGLVMFLGTESPQCLLQGFKIQNAGYGGIQGNGTTATISHCIISGNGPCGATVVKDCHGRIANCLIVDNTTIHGCGMGPVVTGCTEFVNCTIANNASPVSANTSGGVTISNSIIYGNQTSLTLASTVSSSGTPTVKFSLVKAGNLLVNDEKGHWAIAYLPASTHILTSDPCFVRLGQWVGQTLIEGDYHLKSQGYRWEDSTLGPHWVSDSVTSPAIDAGNPIDGLGEELERIPEDLEGSKGVDHAIDLGAYGGTAQASLAPNKDKAPGINAVDLQDYLPLSSGGSWSLDVGSTVQVGLRITTGSSVGKTYFSQLDYCNILMKDIWIPFQSAYYLYLDYTLYRTSTLSSFELLPKISDELKPQYPRFLTLGSTVQVQQDLPGREPAVTWTTVVVRGSLADVLAGTSASSMRMLTGTWPDVLAFKLQDSIGELGEPVMILARGLGPLMWSGYRVTRAVVAGQEFPTSTSSGSATR
jgi:hypothetical protein